MYQKPVWLLLSTPQAVDVHRHLEQLRLRWRSFCKKDHLCSAGFQQAQAVDSSLSAAAFPGKIDSCFDEGVMTWLCIGSVRVGGNFLELCAVPNYVLLKVCIDGSESLCERVENALACRMLIKDLNQERSRLSPPQSPYYIPIRIFLVQRTKQGSS